MTLTTTYSLWLAPLCVLLGVLAAWVLYRRTRERHGWSAALQWTLGSLRALVIAFVAFLLLEPMTRLWVHEVRKPIVVLAHDGSSSLLAVGDTVALREDYGKRLQALATELEGRYQVVPLTYGSRIEDGLHLEQDQGHTDIDQLFQAVYDRYAGADLGAVVIDGDGIFNRGRSPQLAAERLGVPVFPIMLGDTTVHPDLILREVQHNRITYLGNDFPLLVKWRADHLVGRATRLSVTHRGKEVASKALSIQGDPMIAETPLMLKADEAGLQRYSVQLQAVEGEATLANNRFDIYVDVLDDRRRVLLLSRAPHPDVGAIHQAMAQVEGYTVEVSTIDAFNGNLAGYDLVILHQLPSSDRGAQGVLAEVIKRKIPTWTLLGLRTNMRQVNELGLGVQVKQARGGFSDAQGAVSPDFTLFTLEPEQKQALEQFPPLQVPFAEYTAARSASILLSQRIGSVRTGYPLFVFQAQTAPRTAVTCGEGLWRWRLADMQQHNTTVHFDELVQKTVQFLALKQDKSRFRVIAEREFEQTSRVTLAAELYNASYEPVNAPEATLQLTDEDGRELAYTFSRSGTGYQLDVGTLPAGRYTWKARTELDGERLGAQGELLVKPMVAEQLNTVADHALWAHIAARTNGVTTTPGQLETLVQALKDRPEVAPRSYAHLSYSDLIGLRWLFFPLLVLLTVEWAVRRRSGTY